MKLKNNKIILPLLGLIIVCLGVGCMLYGLNTDEMFFFNVGMFLNIAGLFLSSIGLIFTSLKRKK